MADWRQIQARIRKAKQSPDAPAKLSELFQRTRDAMVAWELGLVEEKSGRNDEAAKWYSTAFQRFRRADWKKKAEEALTRLGLPLPERSARKPRLKRWGGSSGWPADVHADVQAEACFDGEDSEPLALGEIPGSGAHDRRRLIRIYRGICRRVSKARPTEKLPRTRAHWGRRNADADDAAVEDAGAAIR